jgi:hypothetical protein
MAAEKEKEINDFNKLIEKIISIKKDGLLVLEYNGNSNELQSIVNRLKSIREHTNWKGGFIILNRDDFISAENAKLSSVIYYLIKLKIKNIIRKFYYERKKI